jgi:hypothetical protein
MPCDIWNERNHCTYTVKLEYIKLAYNEIPDFIEVCCWSRQTPIYLHSKQLRLYRILYNENSSNFIEEIPNPRGIISIVIYYSYIELA